MSNDLQQKLQQLTNRQVVEAGIFLSQEIIDVSTPEEIRRKLEEIYGANGVSAEELDTALEELKDEAKAAESARLLLNIAKNEGLTTEIQTAVEGAGQKQDFGAFTIGVPMLVLTIGILVTKLKKKESKETTVTVEPGGRTTIKSKEETQYYSIGEAAGDVLKKALSSVIPGHKTPAPGES